MLSRVQLEARECFQFRGIVVCIILHLNLRQSLVCFKEFELLFVIVVCKHPSAVSLDRVGTAAI
jgi:hypothetical protein